MTLDIRADTVRRIEACGVVAVIRLQDGSRLHAVVDALAEGGITALEVTMTVPRAIALIGEIAPLLPAGFVLGAGTVVDPDTARAAVASGARFIVSPVFRPSVVEASHAAGAAAMPGCFSPTEILAAWDAGADVVKVFPATALGPAYFKDLRGPLPQVKLMPTGGVSLENAGDWIRAGAVAIGVGGALVDPKLVAADNYAAITERARRFVERVRTAREAPA
ncbi:MAG: bifunctional 4-hydroxy-2-oxoglutarate aldolase/2-dehydro-3-deoxy-phosphogluconate aldolase [Vicinamibacterales bacterium]